MNDADWDLDEAVDHFTGDGLYGDRALNRFVFGDCRSKYGFDAFRRELGERGEDEAILWIRDVLSALGLLNELKIVVQWDTTLGQQYMERVYQNKRLGDILIVETISNKTVVKIEVKTTTEEYEKSVTFPGTDELEVSEADLLIGISLTREGFRLVNRWTMRMTNVKEQARNHGKFWTVTANGPLDLAVILPKFLKTFYENRVHGPSPG